MNVNLNEYVNKRIEELKALKLNTFTALKSNMRTGDNLTVEQVEKKISYYLAAGALAEMEELKKVLNQ